MKISDIPEFNRKHEIVALSGDTTVDIAAKRMAEKNIGAVPVMDKETLVGIFSERDMLKRVVAEGKDPAQTSLKDVMTPDPQHASPDDWVHDAADFMIQGHYRHLPIIDEGKLVGFLSQRDFVAVDLHQLLHDTAKVSFMAIAKAPQVWIMLGGIILYTIFLLSIS